MRVVQNRCPYCRDRVAAEDEGWVACRSCQARHHTACWEEGGACSACGATSRLVPEARRDVARPGPRRAPHRALLTVGLTLAAAGLLLGGVSWVVRQRALTAESRARAEAARAEAERAEAERREAERWGGPVDQALWDEAERAAAPEQALRRRTAAELRELLGITFLQDAFPPTLGVVVTSVSDRSPSGLRREDVIEGVTVHYAQPVDGSPGVRWLIVGAPSLADVLRRAREGEDVARIELNCRRDGEEVVVALDEPDEPSSGSRTAGIHVVDAQWEQVQQRDLARSQALEEIGARIDGSVREERVGSERRVVVVWVDVGAELRAGDVIQAATLHRARPNARGHRATRYERPSAFGLAWALREPAQRVVLRVQRGQTEVDVALPSDGSEAAPPR